MLRTCPLPKPSSTPLPLPRYPFAWLLVLLPVWLCVRLLAGLLVRLCASRSPWRVPGRSAEVSKMTRQGRDVRDLAGCIAWLDQWMQQPQAENAVSQDCEERACQQSLKQQVCLWQTCMSQQPKTQKKNSATVKLRRFDLGAPERTRTSTVLPPLGPEPSASTNSATWARCET